MEPEERWEAVETCERLFRDTRVRVSTEHVGLARLRAMLYGAGGTVAVGGLVVGGAVFGAVGGSLLAQSGNLWNL